VPKFEVVPSVKFEVLLPTVYIDPNDPTKTPHFVQLIEVADYLREMTARYKPFGGYTMTNPVGPPPYSGSFQGEPQERNFWAMIIVPDNFLQGAEGEIQRMIDAFQQTYHQKEILCYYYHVNRYIPSGVP
jgi:hypothetical protein